MNSQKEKQLLQEKTNLCQELTSLSNLIRGSLVKGEKKCGRKGCKCEKGQLHPHVVISIFREGKTQIVYVPKHSKEKAAATVSAYNQAINIIEHISCINVELFKAQKL